MSYYPRYFTRLTGFDLIATKCEKCDRVTSHGFPHQLKWVEDDTRKIASFWAACRECGCGKYVTHRIAPPSWFDPTAPDWQENQDECGRDQLDRERERQPSEAVARRDELVRNNLALQIVQPSS